MLATTTASELTGHWTRMRRSLAWFSGPVSLIHAPSLVDSITTTPEFRFSVHTGKRRDSCNIVASINSQLTELPMQKPHDNSTASPAAFIQDSTPIPHIQLS